MRECYTWNRSSDIQHGQLTSWLALSKTKQYQFYSPGSLVDAMTSKSLTGIIEIKVTHLAGKMTITMTIN